MRSSDDVHAPVEDTQLNVLSVTPLRVSPPPFAVTSVAPPTLNTIGPAVFAVVELIAIAVSLTTKVIVVVPPNAPVPPILVNVCPGIIPVVEESPLITVLVDVLVIFPDTPVMAATDPNVIFLSSIVRSLELSVVVVPFTVRFPERVRFVAAIVPLTSSAVVGTLPTPIRLPTSRFV